MSILEEYRYIQAEQGGNLLTSQVEVDVKKVSQELKGSGFNFGNFFSPLERAYEPFIPKDLDWNWEGQEVLDYQDAHWSNLTPNPPPSEILERTKFFYQGLREKKLKPPEYVCVFGITGVGKSSLVHALRLREDRTALEMDEKYLDNPHLMPYYQAFTDFIGALKGKLGIDLVLNWSDFQPQLLPQGLQEQHAQLCHLQALNQSWFANKKFQQGFEAAGNLISPTVQDVPLGQDIIYYLVQAGLLKSNSAKDYLNDSRLRMQFLPPSIRRPIILFVWAPMEEVLQRIKQRNRPAELIQPDEYWKILYLTKLNWIKAMAKAGVSVLLVDAQNHDFRPVQDGGPEPRITKANCTDAIWQEIEAIHKKLYQDW